MTHTPITPDMPIAEAGRRLMAEELATVQDHWSNLRLAAEPTAVHETRKAIRRTFTLFKLFTPYFAAGVLEDHEDDLRRLMRRLALCRDAAVFRLKLCAYNAAADPPLAELAAYWDERQAKADDKLRAYMARKSVGRALDRYAQLTGNEGAGLPRGANKAAPLLVRHVLPALLFQRVGAVRVWGDILPTATPKQAHQLRIQFKELRYTLTFFDDILSKHGGAVIDLNRRIQEHLGDLNDADVAVDLLNAMKQCREEAALYGDFQRAEVARLTTGFYPLYAEFDRPKLRRDLALAVINL